MNKVSVLILEKNDHLLYKKFQDELCDLCGKLAFDNWLKFLKLDCIQDNGNISFIVKNLFVRDWILQNYKDSLIAACTKSFLESSSFSIGLKDAFEQEVYISIKNFDSVDSNLDTKSSVANNDELQVSDIAINKTAEVAKKKILKNKASKKLTDNKSTRKKKSIKTTSVINKKSADKKSKISKDKLIKTTTKKSKKNTKNIEILKPASKNKNSLKKVNNSQKSNAKGVEKNIEVCGTESEIVVLSKKKDVDKYKFMNNLNSNFTFDNFVVGKPNEFAFNAVKRVAEMEQADSLTNPLFLRGSVGLGKTHLMHAAALHTQQLYPKRRVAYMTAEKFMYQFINALKDKQIMNFKEKFRKIDVLMIDDVQFLCGKEGTQEEFFHTFNSLIEDKKQLIFSADRPPTELKEIEERIRSRLSWGLVVDVNITTFELRLSILQKKVKNFDIFFPREVLEFLAENITSNVRELEGALNRIIAHYNYNPSPITINLIKDLLRDLIGHAPVAVTIRDIQKRVADYYQIRVSDLQNTSKMRKIVRPRQIAMFLAKNLTTKSLMEIGKSFGGRDHTTVMHAIKAVKKLIKTDFDIESDITSLTGFLQN